MATPRSPCRVRGELPSIEALAARVTPTAKAVVPNGSSIAMLLEHQGASVLLSADARPTVLVPALAARAKRRGIAGPLPVDAVKWNHHGSRANVTQDLLQAVDARHFVFNTNNSNFRHSNAEAVARVIGRRQEPDALVQLPHAAEQAMEDSRPDREAWTRCAVSEGRCGCHDRASEAAQG